MSDYILRDAAIDEIYHHFPSISHEEAAMVLHTVPSADVVEVVRCKECKFYVIHTLFGRSQGWCERLCDEFDRSLARGAEQDDFCSKGERRTDG